MGDEGPLVCTSWWSQSMAAVAAVPPVPGGNLVPAFKAIVWALLPLKMHWFRHSSNIRATPGALGRYPPMSRPLIVRPPLGLLK